MSVTIASAHCNTCDNDGEVGVDFYPYLLTKCNLIQHGTAAS